MIVRLYVVSVFLFLMTGCVSADSDIPNEVSFAVKEYYMAEAEENWGVVYSYRTPEFKKNVVKDEFIKVMTEDNAGWVMQSYTIKAAQINGSTATLNIEFKDKPPPQFWAGSGVSNMEFIVSNEVAVWVKKSGKWFCEKSPSRWHLSYSQ